MWQLTTHSFKSLINWALTDGPDVYSSQDHNMCLSSENHFQEESLSKYEIWSKVINSSIYGIMVENWKSLLTW